MRHCTFFIFIIFTLLFHNVVALNIKGKIIDIESKSPILGSKVQLFDGMKNLTPITIVEMDGSFNILLNNFEGTHLTIKITADKYHTLRKTIIIESNECNLGILNIKQLPTIKLSKLYIAYTSDSLSSNVDFFIQSLSLEKVVVKSISIYGNKKNNSTCLDGSPKLTFDIKDKPQSKEAIIREKGDDTLEKVSITGIIDMLPCGQIRLNYTINYPFMIEQNESFKTRIKIPTKILYKGIYQQIDLTEWASISLILELEDGSKIQSKL